MAYIYVLNGIDFGIDVINGLIFFQYPNIRYIIQHGFIEELIANTKVETSNYKVTNELSDIIVAAVECSSLSLTTI